MTSVLRERTSFLALGQLLALCFWKEDTIIFFFLKGTFCTSIVCRSSCGQVCQMPFVGLAHGAPKFDFVDGWRLFVYVLASFNSLPGQ